MLYPSSLALRSPFLTDNEKSGLGVECKHMAAMLGDVTFQAPQRELIQAKRAEGVTTC